MRRAALCVLLAVGTAIAQPGHITRQVHVGRRIRMAGLGTDWKGYYTYSAVKDRYVGLIPDLLDAVAREVMHAYTHPNL